MAKKKCIDPVERDVADLKKEMTKESLESRIKKVKVIPKLVHPMVFLGLFVACLAVFYGLMASSGEAGYAFLNAGEKSSFISYVVPIVILSILIGSFFAWKSKFKQ